MSIGMPHDSTTSASPWSWPVQGDRARNMWRALRAMPGQGIEVLRTSSLYETAAAYVTDQPSFLNAAALVRTSLPPLALLSALKGLEAAAGRDIAGAPRWGPRPLDLDIIFYGCHKVQHGKLDVPHMRCGLSWVGVNFFACGPGGGLARLTDGVSGDEGMHGGMFAVPG